MRVFFVATLMAAIIGTVGAIAAIAHEGWSVRVSPTKPKRTEFIWLSPAADRASTGPD